MPVMLLGKRTVTRNYLLFLSTLQVFYCSDALCTYGTTQANAGKTCREILLMDPDCFGLSGEYWVTCGTKTVPVQVYCEMHRLRGGWERLAKDNYTSGDLCPSDWEYYDEVSNGLRYCSTGSSYSAKVILKPVCPYSEVNGYLVADQKGIADGFYGQSTSIGKIYVNGVSITSGYKAHIFTYAIGREEGASLESCECHGSTTTRDAAFIRWNFMCDSAMVPLTVNSTLVGYRVLWSGRECGPASSCCHTAGAPWFYHRLPNPTSRNIRVKILSNSQGRTLIREMELYVR